VVSEVVIRALSPGEVCAAELLLDAELGGRHQVRLGEVHDVLALAGYGGWDSDRLVGIATYALVGDRARLATLAATADRQRGGIGGRLVEVVASAAANKGEPPWDPRRLWIPIHDELILVRPLR
jgi:hypothetical protein